MRRFAWVALVASILGLALWIWPGARHPDTGAPSEPGAGERQRHAEPVRTTPGPRAGPASDGAAVQASRAVLPTWRPPSRAKADALRAALRERSDHDPTAAPPRRPDAASPEASSGFRDRIGLDDATKTAFARDFMPLVDECIEMARERQPELRGMLAIELGAAGDPELGAVVDRVVFAERNEIDDLELRECVEQSAWSLTLPPPPDASREDLLLTIPVGDAE